MTLQALITAGIIELKLLTVSAGQQVTAAIFLATAGFIMGRLK
jgi:hypothetical protein